MFFGGYKVAKILYIGMYIYICSPIVTMKPYSYHGLSLRLFSLSPSRSPSLPLLPLSASALYFSPSFAPSACPYITVCLHIGSMYPYTRASLYSRIHLSDYPFINIYRRILIYGVSLYKGHPYIGV